MACSPDEEGWSAFSGTSEWAAVLDMKSVVLICALQRAVESGHLLLGSNSDQRLSCGLGLNRQLPHDI